jgi:hypothetical protein
MARKRKPGPRKPEDNYDVGYGKPPEHSRFKPGQSGNPKGRPKGTRNFSIDVKATLRSRVQVTRDGKPTRVSTQEAALLRLREKALKGDARALDALLDLARIYNDEEQVRRSNLSSDDAALLEIYNARLKSGAADAPQPAGPTPAPQDGSKDNGDAAHDPGNQGERRAKRKSVPRLRLRRLESDEE